MSLAFLGAHRTGKSTLGLAFARKHDLPFVQTGTSEVFKVLGLDPKAEYPIEQRIAVQAAILRALEGQWLDAARRSVFYISDRSPLDLAGYLLADVSRLTLKDRAPVAEAVTGYVQRCIESANRFFSTLILVQPGIVPVEEPGKAPACPAYMEHLNQTMAGLMGDDRVKTQVFKIARRITDLDQRVSATEQALAGALANYEVQTGAAIRKGLVTLH